MVTQSLTDQEIEQILSGVAPGHRDDLAAVAGLVQAMRTDVDMEAPRPSGELAALLAGRPLSQSSQAPRPRARALKRVLAGISGFGLSLQLGLGAAAATGAVGAAGLAGVLPQPVQHVFDEVVGRHQAIDEKAPEEELPPRSARTSVARLGPEPLPTEPAADDESARDRGVKGRDSRRDRSDSIARPRTGQVVDAPDRQRTDSRPHPDADKDPARHETDDRRDDIRSLRGEVEDGPERDTEDRAPEREPREPREPRESADDEDEAEDSDEEQVEEDDEVEEGDDVEEDDEVAEDDDA